jgi:hypothetical protein
MMTMLPPVVLALSFAMILTLDEQRLFNLYGMDQRAAENLANLSSSLSAP